MKCSASSLGGSPTRLPRYFLRGTLVTGGRPLSERATRWPASPGHRVYEVDPGTGRAPYRNVGLAIVGGLVKPNLYVHGFRGTSIDYRSHEPPPKAVGFRSSTVIGRAEIICPSLPPPPASPPGALCKQPGACGRRAGDVSGRVCLARWSGHYRVPVGLYLVLSATAQSLRRRLSSCCHFSL